MPLTKLLKDTVKARVEHDLKATPPLEKAYFET